MVSVSLSPKLKIISNYNAARYITSTVIVPYFDCNRSRTSAELTPGAALSPRWSRIDRNDRLHFAMRAPNSASSLTDLSGSGRVFEAAQWRRLGVAPNGLSFVGGTLTRLIDVMRDTMLDRIKIDPKSLPRKAHDPRVAYRGWFRAQASSSYWVTVTAPRTSLVCIQI